MEDWLHLINAETEEELLALQQTRTIPEVKETIVKLRDLSAEAYYREKRLYDEASALGSARREGRAEGAQLLRESLIEKWRKAGKTEEQIKALLDE